MLERENAALAAAEKARQEAQRAEAIVSASKLAPWAKKAQEDRAGGASGHGGVGARGGSRHGSGNGGRPGDAGLSLAEIQKLEEERERELRIQREIEEEQMREIRRREEEEYAKRQQVIMYDETMH